MGNLFFQKANRLVLLSCLTLSALSNLSCGDSADAYKIAIPDLKLSDQEAVSSFELDIKGGTVQNIAGLPVGWSISIENEVAYTSKVAANSRQGSATLSMDELKRVILMVKRNQTGDAKFDISGTFMLTGGPTRLRKAALTTHDFALSGA